MSQTPSQEKIAQLQMFEQGMQSILAQKQQFQGQLVETESALEEISKAKEAYRIIGNVMIRSDIPKMKDELEKKKELLDLRVKAIEKQEQQLKDKASKLQEEVLQSLKK